MYVHVKLLKGYAKILTYKIPASWQTTNLEGSVITVPLKNMVVPALVVKAYPHPPKNVAFEIKEAVGRDHLPPDELYAKFIQKISSFYCTPRKILYQRMRGFIYTKEKATRKKTKKIKEQNEKNAYKAVTLTEEQQLVVDYFLPRIDQKIYSPTLLHGVTGSGKTEIYKKIITRCIEQNKSVVLLLPEVSLSMQFENLLQKQLPPDIPIFSFHSATKISEKKELWQRLLDKKPSLIMGVHLPVMLPIPNLGCIIVDEEHEPGFQEKKHPKINSKEMALWRAKLYNIPIMLGSATPSLNSLYNVEQHGWKLFKLTKRFSGNFPKIKTVKIKGFSYGKSRKNFWITRELERAIAERLQKKEQAMIYLNRRGYSFFVQCKPCGYTFICPNCSVSLTPHKGANDVHTLCCHYCDHFQPDPDICPECKKKDLLRRGIGTQQVVTILQELFPTARIARADLDTTKKKRLWSETVEKFEKNELDILVGTQTITKGYHFPNVTLVGILWADLNVHFPVFNASETALQQLIQVAGRAGRQSEDSLVIAQIMHDHPIFSYLNETDYVRFCEEEMKFREETNYPPFGRFVQIELKHTDEQQIDDDAQTLCDRLMTASESAKNPVFVLGPAMPLVSRIQKIHIRQIFLKAKSFQEVYDVVRACDFDNFDSQVFLVPTQ